MTYPLIQTGSLTLPSGTYTMSFLSTQAQQQIPNFNVAGASEGTTATHPLYVQGIKVQEWIGTGVVRRDGTTNFGLSQNSTFTFPADLDVKAQNWRVRRFWPLVDVTGSGDASKEYTYGLPYTSMSVGGFAKDGYIADYDAESISITTELNRVGTLAGTLKLAQKADVMPHSQGGVTRVQLAGQFSGAPTFTPVTAPGTDDDFEWLLGTSVVAPVEAQMTLNIGGTEGDLTPNVIVYDVTVSTIPQRGGDQRVICRMRSSL